MYHHDPMQFANSEHRLYPAVPKSYKKENYLGLILVALFLLASLIN